MIDKRRVAALLAQGVAETAIADSLGCEPSYISQLKHDNEVQELIKAAEKELSIREAEFDELLFTTKHKALQQVSKMLPFADMNKALATFRVLDGAHAAKSDNKTPSVDLHVTLTLPEHAVPRYVVDSRNQIVEVEGRTMISATPQTLDQILQARAEGNQDVPKLTPPERAVVRLGGLMQLPPRTPRESPVKRGPIVPSDL